MSDISVALNPLLQALQKNTETYSKFAEQMRIDNTNTGRGKRETGRRIDTLEKDQRKKAAKALVELRDALESAAATTRTGGKVSKRQHADIEEAAKKVKKQGGEIYDVNEDLIKQAKKYGSTRSTSMMELAKLSNDTRDAIDVQGESMAAREREIKISDRLWQKYDNLSDQIRETARNFFTLKSAITQIAGSLTLTSAHFNDVVKAQQYSYSFINEGFEDSATLSKMSSEAFHESMMKHRNLVLATGGDYADQRAAGLKWHKTLNEMIPTMQGYAGKADEAGALIMDSAELFSKTGVKVLHEDIAGLNGPLNQYMKQMQRLTKLTATQGQAINQQLAGYLESQDGREAMLQLDKKEKMAYVNRLAREAELYVVQGKSMEQFIAVKHALAGLAGINPKTRLKEAARIMAVSGAMGMQVDPRMLQMMSKSPTQLTADEEMEMQQFATRFQKLSAQRLGSENFGTAATQGGLLEMAGGPVLDAMMTLSSAADAGQSVSEKQLKAATDNTKILDGIAGGLRKFFERFDAFTNFFQDPSLGIFTGLATAIVTGIKAILMFGFLSKLGSMMGLGSMAGGAGRAAGMLGGMLGGGAAGAVGAVGLLAASIYDLSKAVDEGNSTSADIAREFFPNAMDNLGASLHGDFQWLGEALGMMSEQEQKLEDSRRAAEREFTKTQNDAMYAHIDALMQQQMDREEAWKIAVDQQIKTAKEITKEVRKQGEVADEHEKEKKDKLKKIPISAANWVSPPP